MTSTVTARLAEGRDAVDVLGAIFPCGSVTGAPKIRAMELIYEVEPDARGPYTGSIGYLGPDRDAAFNVAIRTLAMKGEGDHATIGLGSGIVADSDPAGEWNECLAKGAFVTAAVTPFDLIETMRFNPHDGLCELERHLLRMKTSGEALGFIFDRHAVRNELQAATFRLRDTRVIRLRLSRSGMVAIEVKPLPPTPAIAEVALMPLPVHSSDFRLRHKTSDRAFYDDSRKGTTAFEVIFTDHQGFVTEGSFTNIFLKRADGIYATPPLGRGLIPGVLRSVMIEQGEAVEHDLRPADLVAGFFIGNSLRGLIPATLVAMADQPGL
jgi:para-aminobenzoate synthetase/4-amino-4-deoxychorismate lyase